jgi:putative endonuclease
MARHNEFGIAAETAAAACLAARGWTILHRNWRWRRLEIDLIVRRGSVVAFVEVRARRSTAYGHPLETIGWRKRRDLERAAHAWIRSHSTGYDERSGADVVYRFDVVTLSDARSGAAGELEHLEDAWRPG